MKKLRGLLLLAGIAVLLIGSYLFLRARANGQQESAAVELFTATAMQRIDLTYRGEEMHFEKTNGAWACADMAQYPLNTAYLRDMEKQLCTLVAQHRFTKEEAGFGLDAPTCIVQAIADDGREIALRLGNENPTANVVYAAFDDGIYALDDAVIHCFSHTLKEMAAKNIIPKLQAFQTQALTLQNENGEIILTRAGDALQFADGRTADAATVEALHAALSSLQLQTLVAFQPTDADRESYGLAAPRIACRVDGKDKGLDVTLGVSERNGQWYAYIAAADAIYEIDTPPDLLVTLTGEMLLDRQLIATPYEDIAKISFEAGGAAAQAIDDADTAWALYYALSRMRAEGFYETAPAAECTIIIEETSGATQRIALAPVDENFYAADVAGVSVFRVGKREVHALYTLLGVKEES